ncbi:MAG: hypothetical protein SFY95_08285 [Planctomycetota bacterium]|nr:hypothetical protein [Planctomycetota bacterium]
MSRYLVVKGVSSSHALADPLRDNETAAPGIRPDSTAHNLRNAPGIVFIWSFGYKLKPLRKKMDVDVPRAARHASPSEAEAGGGAARR